MKRLFPVITIVRVLFSGGMNCTPSPAPTTTPTPAPAQPPSSSIEPGGIALNPEDVPRVSKQELLQKLESQANIIVVDTRGKQAYDNGHIKGSIYIPYSELMEGRWQPPPDKEVIFYCDRPAEATSAGAALELMKRGFLEVQVLLGGYLGWKEAGYPTEPAPAPVPAPALAPAPSSSPGSSVDGLLSSDALTKGCQRSRPSGGFENVGLAVGESAIDFTLRDVDGNTFNLAELLSEKPVVMVSGSFTWPPFRQRCAANENLSNRYGDDVHFIIIYVWEAHPIEGRPSPYTYDEEGNPIHQPTNYGERVEMARKTIAAEDITVTVLVDGMDNALMCTYGPAPNNAYLIGTDGKIIAKQGWYQPNQMEAAVQEYLDNE